MEEVDYRVVTLGDVDVVWLLGGKKLNWATPATQMCLPPIGLRTMQLVK